MFRGGFFLARNHKRKFCFYRIRFRYGNTLQFTRRRVVYVKGGGFIYRPHGKQQFFVVDEGIFVIRLERVRLRLVRRMRGFESLVRKIFNRAAVRRIIGGNHVKIFAVAAVASRQRNGGSGSGHVRRYFFHGRYGFQSVLRAFRNHFRIYGIAVFARKRGGFRAERIAYVNRKRRFVNVVSVFRRKFGFIFPVRIVYGIRVVAAFFKRNVIFGDFLRAAEVHVFAGVGNGFAPPRVKLSGLRYGTSRKRNDGSHGKRGNRACFSEFHNVFSGSEW